MTLHSVCVLYTQDLDLVRKIKATCAPATQVRHVTNADRLNSVLQQSTPALCIVDLRAKESRDWSSKFKRMARCLAHSLGHGAVRNLFVMRNNPAFMRPKICNWIVTASKRWLNALSIISKSSRKTTICVKDRQSLPWPIRIRCRIDRLNVRRIALEGPSLPARFSSI